MTDTDIQAVDTPAPDANVPEVVETTETVAEPSPAVSDADESSRPKGVGKRIDELTRLRRDAERERDHWREMALRTQTPEPVKAPEAPTQPKTLADFEFDEGKYQSYLFGEATRVATDAARKELQAEQARTTQAQRKTAFQGRETAFAKENPDYLEVTRDPSVPITAQMAEVIAASDVGPALAYHLAKNIALAEDIAGLSRDDQLVALGELKAQLKYERRAAEEARKRVSAAPPPTPSINAIDASPAVKTTDASGDVLSDEEWVRMERKRTSRKR